MDRRLMEVRNEVYRDMMTYRPASERGYEGKQDSLLHRAVRYCDTDIVLKVLQLGVNVNATNGKRQTAAHYAAKRHSMVWETLVLLTKYHAKYDIVDVDGNLALHYAVENPASEMLVVAEILTEKLDLNVRNRLGKTPLHIALEQANCRSMTIIYMILFGAKVNMHTAVFNYPFHCAVQSGNCKVKVLNALKSNSADINAVNSIGETPLSHALRNPRCKLSTIKTLLKHGARLEPMNEERISALGQAARYSCPQPILDVLFFNGAIVNCGVHPVELAIKAFQSEPSERRMKIVKQLIRYCILEDISYDVDGMIADCYGPPQLFGYAEQCADEIFAMHNKVFRSNITVLNIVHDEFSADMVMEGLLGSLSDGDFPLFRREISYHVKRQEMKEELRKCAVLTHTESKTVALCHDVVMEIIQYLPDNHDVFSLLISSFPYKAVDYLPILVTEECDEHNVNPNEALKNDPREALKNNPKEAPKNNPREAPKNNPREAPKNNPTEAPKNNPKRKTNKCKVFRKGTRSSKRIRIH